MAAIKELFGTANQSITITLDALANGSARQSTAIDNTASLFLDALVQVKPVGASSGVSATGTVEVWAYGTVDGGSTYSDGATGTDGAITPTSPPNLALVGVVNVVANSQAVAGRPMSVAAAFGGVLPAKWGLVVVNKSGAALGSGCAATYQGVYSQTV